MAAKTQVAIVGFGNVGRGVHNAAETNRRLYDDMEVVAILSRDPGRVTAELKRKSIQVPVFGIADFTDLTDVVDVAMLCGGSKKDLPEQGPYFARHFNTIDSFDTHGHIGPYIDEETKKLREGYLADVEAAANATGHTSAISIGWDPGTFSMERILADAYLPGTRVYAFYGLGEKGGLSMGHSDAIRSELKHMGITDARQFTHAIHEAIEKLRRGENPDLKPGDMHWRECFVVTEKDADRKQIEDAIKDMPNYFRPYRTEVHFVSQEELEREHSDMYHDGLVIAVAETSPGKKGVIEYRCRWDNNPEATGNIMVAHARAVHRMHEEGVVGALRPIDIPARYLSPRKDGEINKRFM